MYTCKICNKEFDSERYTAEEIRFRLGHKFDYVKCRHCNCLQIVEIPKDLDDYYDVGKYYSLQERDEKESNGLIRRMMRKYLLKYRMNGRNIVGRLMTKLDTGAFEWVEPGMMTFNSSILDIGCGTGRTLLKLANSGFNNLQGIDPYIGEDISYKLKTTTVNIYKRAIEELEGSYDVITLNHVMEHLANPHQALESIAKVMTEKSTLVLALPITSNFTWKHYGIKQYQLIDAPRHLFIYSIDSLRQLGEQHGLELVEAKPYFYYKLLYDVYGKMADELKSVDKSKLVKQLMNDGDTGHAYVYFKKKIK